MTNCDVNNVIENFLNAVYINFEYEHCRISTASSFEFIGMHCCTSLNEVFETFVVRVLFMYISDVHKRRRLSKKTVDAF